MFLCFLNSNIFNIVLGEQATYYFNVDNYSSYLIILKHDGGDNVAVYLISCGYNFKTDMTILPIQKNTYFNIEIEDGKVKITSTLKYWILNSFKF